MEKKGFPPRVNKETEKLILGSLPGDESIKKQQYYGHPGNDFWKLAGKAIKENLAELEYEERIQKLLEKKIGLWDVFASGLRQGSEDSKIKKEKLNNFTVLTESAPKIRKVFFNGKKAGALESFFKEKGFQTKVLPSSSALNRRNLKEREMEWKKIKEF